MENSQTRWEQLSGGRDSGDAYAARFADLASSGADVHGEASFCDALLAPGSRVLDAGCGTGRVAARLAELGHACTGVDLDASMLAVARRVVGVRWVQQDLASLDLCDRFDLVVMAGNVVPLLAEGTVVETMQRVAGTLTPGGLLVAGFGLAPSHLPAGCPVTPLADYDSACERAGFELIDRSAGWAHEPWSAGGPYAVSVHRAADASG